MGPYACRLFLDACLLTVTFDVKSYFQQSVIVCNMQYCLVEIIRYNIAFKQCELPIVYCNIEVSIAILHAAILSVDDIQLQYCIAFNNFKQGV